MVRDLVARDWRLAVERMVSPVVGWHARATHLVGSGDTRVPYDGVWNTVRAYSAWWTWSRAMVVSAASGKRATLHESGWHVWLIA